MTSPLEATEESNGLFASLCSDGCYLGEILRRLLLSISTRDRLEPLDHALARLVSFKDSELEPVHSWFRYKEGFSPKLLDYIAAWRGTTNLGSVLDMFAGVGTTVLGCQTSSSIITERALGIEYNPLIADIARLKLLWWKVDASKLQALAHRIVAATDTSRDGRRPPSHATLNNPRIFPPPIMSAWLALWEGIANVQAREVERSLAKLALLSVAEQVSNAKKDGRALRIIQRHSPETLQEGHAIVQAAFLQQVSLMTADLESDWARQSRAIAKSRDATVARGNGVKLRSVGRARPRLLVAPASIDTFLYSPPYLNFIDYTEVYKVECWLGGYVGSEQEFRTLREGTLRSHPSIVFPDRKSLMADLAPQAEVTRILSVLQEFLIRHATSSWHRRATQIVSGYFEDIYECLRSQSAAAAPGAIVACAVGNSLLAQRDRDNKVEWAVTVPTDLIISLLAEAAGFRVEGIIPARSLQPRNVRFASSRESLILMSN